jgi:hypothetical protein
VVKSGDFAQNIILKGLVDVFKKILTFGYYIDNQLIVSFFKNFVKKNCG